MIPNWNMLIEEVKKLIKEPEISRYFNKSLLESALVKGENALRIENMSDPNYRILMRSVIVYRLMKKYFERGD